MTAALVGDSGIQTASSVTSDAVAYSPNPTSGNLLAVAIAGWNTPNFAMSTVTDTQSNAYTEAIALDFTDFQDHISVWYSENITGGANTVTLTPTGSGNYMAWVAMEFSGLLTASALDITATNTGFETATDANVTSGTTNQANELVLAVAAAAISGSSDVEWGASAATGYTNVAQYENYSAIQTISVEYKVVSSVGAQSAAWEHVAASSSGDGWGAAIVTFKEAVAADVFIPHQQQTSVGRRVQMVGY